MKRLVALLTTLVVVGSIAVASFASESGGGHEERGRVATHGRYTRYHVSEEAQRAALEYWTPARMEAAVPLDMARIRGQVVPVERSASLGIQRGTPGYIRGVAAEDSSRQPAVVSPAGSTAKVGGYEYPFPFSRYEIPGLPDYTSYPYSTVGKIFATNALGDYECSGAAVVSANGSVVWTAGHCVHLIESGWFTNLIFVPAFRDGARPFGSWVAVDAWAKSSWLNKEDDRADVAAVVVDTSPTGATLEEMVGSLGFAWNVGRIEHWEAFGYPADQPFDGNRQHVCSASFAVNDSYYKRRFPVGIGCDMTPGSSGGPWILDFGDGYYLNGVNSYSLPRIFPESMFSPYFGGGMLGLLECAEDGVC